MIINKPIGKSGGYGGCLVWFVLLIFIGCQSVQKATDYLKKKDALAELCADTYPVRDSLIKGDSIITTDTLWGLEFIHDSTMVETKDTIIRTITRPVTVTKVIRVTDTIVKENTARVEALQVQNGKLYEQNMKLVEQRDKFKEQRNKIRIWFWILVGAIGLYTFLKIKKVLPV